MTEIFFDARRKGILTYVVCATDEVQQSIKKFGIKNDEFTSHEGLEKFREFGGIIPTIEKKAETNIEVSEKGDEEKESIELKGINGPDYIEQSV